MSTLHIAYVILIAITLGASCAGLALKSISYFFATFTCSLILLILMLVGGVGAH